MATSSFTALAGKQFMSLTTFRKSGDPVPTPVWFFDQGGTLYVQTIEGTGKLKRIHNDSKVTVAPCTANGKLTGPSANGNARIVTNASEMATAEAALAKKYHLLRIGFGIFTRLESAIKREKAAAKVYVAIEPAN